MCSGEGGGSVRRADGVGDALITLLFGTLGKPECHAGMGLGCGWSGAMGVRDSPHGAPLPALRHPAAWVRLRAR